MTYQILAEAVFNSVRFSGAVLWTFTTCSKTSQRCTIGFNSWPSRWPRQKSSEECSSNQSAVKPGLVRGTVVLLENSITVRITEQHERMEMVTQQFYEPNCIVGGSCFFAAWDVKGMVLDIVVLISTTGHVSAVKGVNNDTVDEESALLDEEDAAEVDKLLDVEEQYLLQE
ncbi:hypothetical protein TNCV_3150191 [Trichonephila clavipes]|nr:hypothetical protein TNCV_3150191 [Trichonephila clavipes]